jgi:murein DD-endopeptidase MepM/ murein hydrolase activator NlpD
MGLVASLITAPVVLSLALLAADLVPASVSLSSADLAAGGQTTAAPVRVVAGRRQRHTTGPAKRGIHELEDPAGWPAEPSPENRALDAARFDAAVTKLCAEVAPEGGLDAIARVVREVSAETGADPFLTAALVYRQSRCRPALVSVVGIGLLQIKPGMFAAGASLPFPRTALARENLLDPAQNLRVGIALLKMWSTEHEAQTIDSALGSTPHRSAVAHFFWGDKVWGTTAEDRTFTARRRLLEAYANQPIAKQPSSLGLEIISPLEGAPRLGTSAPGADREGGERRHRGLDVDATVGEPVRAVADGVVQFAGADMPGDHPALDMAPRYLRRWRNRNLGPGGFFVRIVHTNGLRTGYFHLNSYRVVSGQQVVAGEVIGSVGRTGVKVSGSHLHFEVHVDGELKDPVRFLSAFVLPPDKTITHRVAMAEKRQRVSRMRRQARAAARHRLS